MKLPLEGIKVIDFTGVQAGPACTQLMAALLPRLIYAQASFNLGL